MWTENKKIKGHRLSWEVLGILAACFLMAVALGVFLIVFGMALVEHYCFTQDIILSEEQLYSMDRFVFTTGILVSVAFFMVMFLALLGERLAYIHKIIKGIDILRSGELTYRLPSEGNNELTQLAEAINELSVTRQEIKDREERMQAERDELIRTLSHDIRTPLTAILSYSQWLASQKDCSPEEQRAYLDLVTRKSEQIKELTDILLEGGKRAPEYMEDASLFMQQLAGEFEELLEDQFTLSVDLSRCPVFSGSFDVGELRRVFDNLISNIQKYADPQSPVELTLVLRGPELTIRQRNAVAANTDETEGHHLGLNSIRRILQNYKGRVDIYQDERFFEITLVFSDF